MSSAGSISVWVREPILHFLLIGLGIFLVYQWLNPESSTDSRIIEVNRESIGQFIEFRTQSFSGNTGDKLDSLSAEALADIINRYITEEALYRRALSHGMDQQDYVIKRRLVQKMEFLAEGTTPAIDALTTKELEQYYAQHMGAYEIPAAVTFTHVFISRDRHGDETEQRALSVLDQLVSRNVRFDQAPRFGERFPYQLNYVEKTEEEVAGHFGKASSREIFQLPMEPDKWQGPLSSPFGEHLILLIRKQSSRIPTFEEVRDQIATEVQRQRENESKQLAIEKVLREFEVRVSPALEARIAQALNTAS